MFPSHGGVVRDPCQAQAAPLLAALSQEGESERAGLGPLGMALAWDQVGGRGDDVSLGPEAALEGHAP
jgi:hypothetical protein